MTPPAAATVAGRRVASDTEADYVPRAPRRVSGPARPAPRPEPRHRARPATRPSSRATAAAAALEATLAPAPTRTRREAPAPAPRRRRPEPARPRSTSQRRPRTQAAPRLAVRLQAPRLDRIVRGRAWIPVLGVLLVAIVGLRVEVLKLGSSVGSQIQQATLLQSSNSELRTQISALSDNQRITTLAEHYGMHMPNPLDVHILQAAAGTHVQAAIGNISAPSNSTYLSGLATEQQTSQQSTNAIAALNGASVTGTTSTGTSGGVGATAGGSTTTATGTSSQAPGTTATSTSGGQAASTSSTATGATSTSAGAPPASSSTGSTTGSTGTATNSAGLNTSSAGITSSSNTAQNAGTTVSANGGGGLAG